MVRRLVGDLGVFTVLRAPDTGGDSPTTPAKRKADVDGQADTPSKKPKATPKPRAKKTDAQVQETSNQSSGEEYPQDAENFMKKELEWESSWV